MGAFLTIEDGLRRSLGFLPDDLDDDEKKRMSECLQAAEWYIQNAIGDDPDGSFYQSDQVKPLYTVACNSLAGTYFQNPVNVSGRAMIDIDAVTNAIIGQLRGQFARKEGYADG